jgi:hypothetical protein
MPITLDSIADIYVTALTAWRENRGGHNDGMQSVICAIANRVAKHHSSFYAQCIQPAQFSSMTVQGPEAILWPEIGDQWMAAALNMAAQAVDMELPDITQGATLYYAPKGIKGSNKTFTKPDGTVVTFPQHWDPAKVIFTVEIEDQLFFKEK